MDVHTMHAWWQAIGIDPQQNASRLPKHADGSKHGAAAGN
jgi:hypothetical protein